MAAGSEIKRLRRKHKKSAADVSEWIGVDAEKLRKWESRDADPKDSDDRRKVEKYFKTPLAELIKLEDFQFYEPEKEAKPIADSALISAIIRHLSKLEAKVYGKDELDCMRDIKKSANLILEERLDIKPG